MLLSICIPTFNRLLELKTNLRFLIDEVASNYNNDIEIIISDNCSADGTFEYLNELKSKYPFLVVSKNTDNIGMIPNWKKSISLAQGKFVWLLGSDDIVIPGRFSTLIDKIHEYPDSSIFLLNNISWTPTDADFLNFDESIFNTAEKHVKDSHDEYVHKIADLLGKREDQFTPIYLSVMKKADWSNAIDLYDLESPFFSSLKNSVPQAVYVAEQLFNKQGCYISTPMVLASYNIGWKKYYSLYCFYYLILLHKLWLQNGADSGIVNNSLKRYLDRRIWRALLKDLFITNRENLKYFSFFKYFSMTYKFPEAYKIFIYIIYLNGIYFTKKIGTSLNIKVYNAF